MRPLKFNIKPIPDKSGNMFYNNPFPYSTRACLLDKNNVNLDKYNGTLSITPVVRKNLLTGITKHPDEMIFQFIPSEKIINELCNGTTKTFEMYLNTNESIVYMKYTIAYTEKNIFKYSKEKRINLLLEEIKKINEEPEGGWKK